MELNRYFDHTLLKAEATSDQVLKLCDEALEYHFASVCVNPVFVPLAAGKLAGSDVKVCTVIGFPLGANEPAVKAMEAALAVDEGADEVDMVINIGKAKEKDFAYIQEEIAKVKQASREALLKVIIESSALSDDEIIGCCKAAMAAKADYVKTSTGFHKTGGASAHAVSLMRQTVGETMGVKASGGIHSLAEAQEMIEAGASRIGCSASVAIMEEAKRS
ncbi:MAG: deoxyribose-phosphate aldolase [Bacillales bacterium]|nr:deoxyribose-phosphate aldolase [Bacillales bacterium]MDY5920704.1 deoxyribose-phosphate aldolase [Candidatus Enteromonas sp.]